MSTLVSLTFLHFLWIQNKTKLPFVRESAGSIEIMVTCHLFQTVKNRIKRLIFFNITPEIWKIRSPYSWWSCKKFSITDRKLSKKHSNSFITITTVKERKKNMRRQVSMLLENFLWQSVEFSDFEDYLWFDEWWTVVPDFSISSHHGRYAQGRWRSAAYNGKDAEDSWMLGWKVDFYHSLSVSLN